MTDLTDDYNRIVASLEGRTLEDEWEDNPEPEKTELDGRVILDTNIEGQAWLWHSENPDANLTYVGETMELSR
ncbi:hypothetical protein M199_gp158 [Halogranum tailed virus 1]|uniref:Uncharacterized protein n=1 Tax=Halogranum tailed virus 1 TaxID=1273749 RepID=R4TMU3_9CAUD|nr:hypothetical protein M199_gp158 [Halogranum tailed virus 1]AGM11508.1 hypothetical protein HGTV1_211 [Halogranum tailed virus 1]